jgi:uncharacterized protein (TIGR02231 family)
MKKYLFLLLILIGSYTAANANDGDNKTKATLTNVTVYKVGAELTHTAKADIAQGNSQFTIDNISNSIDINSIQVNCNGNVTIMGVEFSTDNLQDEVKSPQVKFLEDSLERANKNLNKIKTKIDILNELLSILKSNRDVRGTQTGLSVVELTKLVTYYQAKSTSIQNDLEGLTDKQVKLTATINKLTDQIEEEQKKNTKKTGKLILQLNCAIAGKYDFTVSYITQNAYWIPFYDLKADNIKTPLQIIYRAKIYQTTGIDWKQVKLSLSTSTPNESGNAPTLDPWFVNYLQPITRYAMKSLPVEDVATALQGRAAGVEVISDEANKKNAGLEDHTTISDKELNVTFDIDLPYDIPTNGKAQTAVLKKYDVPASYKFFSIPKLDNEVFLLAQISDWEKLNLLPGEANIIFEGTYIGKSFINPSSTDDTLKLTMGVDKRVVVTREKLMDYSSVKFLGSNKKQIFTYEITVKNNKKDAIDISVKDQYPISQNKEIEVELLESKEATVNTETGEVNWNLKLAAGEVKKIRISYSIKYPKDKIVNLQ